MLHPPLTDETYLRQVLGRAGVQPSRSAGQNFLICSDVVDATLTLAKTGPALVTELGAGVGPVTQALAASGLTVRAIERDRTLGAILERQLSPAERRRVTLVAADLRETDWTHEDPYQLIGNIPYNLSGLIIRRIGELEPAPAQAILLVQQEVALRLAAEPPHMHLVSLAVQLWGSAIVALTVPPDCFWPAPAVTSALVLLVPHRDYTPAERAAILSLARPLFQQRRKQLHGTLASSTGLSKAAIKKLLQAVAVDPAARPQELTLPQWQHLASALADSE